MVQEEVRMIRPAIINIVGISFVALVLSVSCAVAADLSYRDQKRGWYWYEAFPEEKHPPDEKATRGPTIPEYSYDRLWNMHPDEFQKHLSRVTKAAVQFPTEENVGQYLKIQDVARRKSVAFASVVNLVGQKNPQYSTEDVYPITAPGRAALTDMQEKEYDQVFLEAQNEFGLIMFSRKDCGFCDAQLSILSFFENQYHWPVRSVDVADHPNFAAQFGIGQTPSIILVNKGSRDHLPISSGVISMSDLKKRLYRSIRYMQGKTSPEQWALYEFERQSGHDPLRFISSEQTK